MRTHIFILAALLGLSACGGEKTLEEKKAALDAKKVELAKLQNEINKMEEELMKGDSSLLKQEDEGILVAVKELVPQHFEHFFNVNGSIEAMEMARVSPEQGGQIKEILVNDGDHVTAGQVLVKLNTSVLQRSLDEVNNGIELAQTVYNRQANLWEQKIGSEMQYLQAKNNLESLIKKKETLLAQMGMSIIKAPFDGIVDVVNQKVGELAAPGMPVLTMVNMKQMKVKVDVSENYVQSVRPRAMVDVEFPSFGYSTKAPIATVGNIINPANRSFEVEVRIPNSEGILKPNGVAVLRIKDFEADSALVVPAITIGKDAKGDFVFVVKEEEGRPKAVKTYVKTGRTSEGHTMIVEGLSKGTRVVVEGFNEIANGDFVKVQG
ncbi:MAG: efflux RND transporter periplasmic adaptor subunit [Flavobacteriales bacterium]|nr:efflux RND transporter periplasmic adaptor subunit [Flavobacteriales bacterium]